MTVTYKRVEHIHFSINRYANIFLVIRALELMNMPVQKINPKQ